MARICKGRRKIAMKKMENAINLQVTFSKRCAGLFKKASELCTLCGAEVAIIVFSPGNKVFAFGHPCVESIIERFEKGDPLSFPNSAGRIQFMEEACRNETVSGLNRDLTEANEVLSKEKKRGEELRRLERAGQVENWWEKPKVELNMAQLEMLAEAMKELKGKVAQEADIQKKAAFGEAFCNLMNQRHFIFTPSF